MFKVVRKLSQYLNVTDPLIISLIFIFLSCRKKVHDNRIQSWKFKTSSWIMNHDPLNRTWNFPWKLSRNMELEPPIFLDAKIEVKTRSWVLFWPFCQLATALTCGIRYEKLYLHLILEKYFLVISSKLSNVSVVRNITDIIM